MNNLCLLIARERKGQAKGQVRCMSAGTGTGAATPYVPSVTVTCQRPSTQLHLKSDERQTQISVTQTPT